MSSATMIKQSCPFLDLPAELRSLVYEYLDVRIRTRLYRLKTPETTRTGNATITVVFKSLSVSKSILATCRVCYYEAKPLFAPLLHQLRYLEPLHFIVDCASFDMVFGKNKHGHGLAAAIATQLQEWREHGDDFSWAPDSLSIGRWTFHPSQVGMWTLDVDEMWYRTFLGFVRKCASYVRRRDSGKLMVTVREFGVNTNQEFDYYRLLDARLYWRAELAPAGFELRIVGFREEFAQTLARFFGARNPLAPKIHRTSFRAISEAEWNDRWDGCEVVEFN